MPAQPKRTETIALRLTEQERQRIEAAAQLDGRTVSDWLRRVALAATGRKRTRRRP